MKNLDQIVIRAKHGAHGLDVYIDMEGKEYYVTTRRTNGLLWTRLKDGITIGELKRIRPSRSHAEQKYYHCSCYLLKLTNDYIKYDLVA
ncbi:hypothetical protein FACS1894187_13580 [Synergistales bacterium]|nr:hypothetical protein FACS1894187_13580 [Synergistales bacterium]